MAYPKKCIVTGCSNLCERNRTMCRSCRHKKYKRKDPLRASYLALKGNAKQRGKQFTITFNQFVLFAKKCELFYHRGRTKQSYHIDRREEDGPYSIDNIQLLTNEDNVKKYLNYRGRDSYKFDVRGRPENNHDNVPF